MKAGERSLRDQALFEQAQELLMLSHRCSDESVAQDLRRIALTMLALADKRDDLAGIPKPSTDQ
jgi:AmiR/NasT family two-component response regulator